MPETAREQRRSRRRRRQQNDEQEQHNTGRARGHGVAHSVEHIVFEQDEQVVGRTAAANVIELEPITVVGDPLAEDKRYEVIAHQVAYLDRIPPNLSRRLQGWGYLPQWQDMVDDRSLSLFAGLLMPDPQQQEQFPDLVPVIAFRGSQEWLKGDLAADFDPLGIGAMQFAANQRLLRLLINQAGGPVDLTGHSLGGALAQRAGLAFVDQVRRVVTFQAPGIRFPAGHTSAQLPAEVTHHVATRDVVDLAGGRHLPGTVYLHQTSQFYEGHSDKELLQGATPPTRYAEHPGWASRALIEGLRQLHTGYGIGAAVAHALTRNDDQDLRLITKRLDSGLLAQIPLAQRAAMIDRLCRGITGDQDEQAILELLQASVEAGDLVRVVEAVEAHQLADALDGAEFRRLRRLLREHYFPQIAEEPAFALLRRCIDGATAEWEEELIADLLVSVAPVIGRALITRLGEIYRREVSLKAGLLLLEEQLDGAEWGRVVAVYGLPGQEE